MGLAGSESVMQGPEPSTLNVVQSYSGYVEVVLSTKLDKSPGPMLSSALACGMPS